MAVTDPRAVKAVFKFVTGVLNKAFNEDCLDGCEADVRSILSSSPRQLSFSDACDALAEAIKSGTVPPQGLNVLKSLLTKEKNGLPRCSSLHHAVGVAQGAPSLATPSPNITNLSMMQDPVPANISPSATPLANPRAVQGALGKTIEVSSPYTSKDVSRSNSSRKDPPCYHVEVKKNSSKIPALVKPVREEPSCHSLELTLAEWRVRQMWKDADRYAQFEHALQDLVRNYSGHSYKITNSSIIIAHESCVCKQCYDEFQKQINHFYPDRKSEKGSKGKGKGNGKGREDPEPPKGLIVERLADTEVEQVKKLWLERGSGKMVSGVWSLKNDHLAWVYRKRKMELCEELACEPNELRGFHGSHPDNILSICEHSFDSGRRAGQVFGAGEYFAKNPDVSVGYCRGGSFMILCQLMLGRQSTTQSNEDGDHIWAAGPQYYVIKHPSQVLPLYIVHFEHSGPLDKSINLNLLEKLDMPIGRRLCLGSAKDDRIVDLKISSLDEVVEGMPAQWWNGDLRPFMKGQLRHIPEDLYLESVAHQNALPKGCVLLGSRGKGKFHEKAENAKKMGASALFIFQDENHSTELPFRLPGLDAELIPTVLISHDDGRKLLAKLTKGQSLKLENAMRRTKEELKAQRDCYMKQASTEHVWMGYFHSYFSDEQLSGDIRCFFERHCAAAVTTNMQVRIVRGKFTQAKVRFQAPGLTQAEVKNLNTAEFIECGTKRTVAVDDARGAPGQRCTRTLAGYCRYRNLRFNDPCFCDHDPRPTEGASYRLVELDLCGAKADDIRTSFLRTFPGGRPTITAIRSIHNERLEAQHELYRKYLEGKHWLEPVKVELYHGTNMNILDTIYTHGLAPPSDMQADDGCPVSGKRGLCTSLCNNDCQYCTKRHVWNYCHMYGLGIYLGDMAEKSNRYVSQWKRGENGRECRKMILCSVWLGESLQVEGHLKDGKGMHDVATLRNLQSEDLPQLFDFTKQPARGKSVDQRDILFVKGLGPGCARSGYSVINNEYISFHPYQCMPRYEITYEI